MKTEWKILQGDALERLKEIPDESVDMCVTSPPYYGLRDYGIDGQIGLEETPEEFIAKLADVFDEVKRVLKTGGTLWVNIWDSYNTTTTGSITSEKQLSNKGSVSNTYQKKIVEGCKPKDLIGIPWMLAFELRKRGWYLRQDIIWHKPNPMPESVTDRCTKSHEYIFLLSKSPKYYFDHEAIQEIATGYDGRKDTMLKGSPKYEDTGFLPEEGVTTSFQSRPHERWRFKNLQDKGQVTHTMHERRSMGMEDVQYPVRNKRDVWSVPTKPYSGAHFATFPEKLIEPCILAGSTKDGTVLDPFNGAATTGVVCLKTGRRYVGIELNPEYIEISENRLTEVHEAIEAEKAQVCFFDSEFTVEGE